MKRPDAGGVPPAASGFHERAGRLFASELPLSELAARFGTPLYVYDAAVLGARHERLRRGLAPLAPRLHYSVKACSNLAILRLLHALGLAFDVVSGGELERCLRAGIPPQELVFAGAGKTPAEIARGVEAGVGLFHVESHEELELLAEEAAARGRTVGFALRLNPDVPVDTHHYVTTGRRRNKFGLAPDDAARALATLHSEQLEFRGAHVHLGSQIRAVAPYVQAAQVALAFLERVPKAPPRPILNLGGGFGIAYAEDEPELDVPALAQALGAVLAGRPLELAFEPGRYLVAPAGVLVTRVLSLKHAGGSVLVVVDAGMNDLLRPALYESRHRVRALEAAPPELRADVVGPICETSDFLARDVALPRLAPGDLLAVLDAGAYGFSMASNYNTRPRPAEVLVQGGDARLIRRRETLEDLLRPELDPGP